MTKTTANHPKVSSLTDTTPNMDGTRKRSDSKEKNIARNNIEKNYNCYYSTGAYKSRYPSVNQQTLSTIHQALPYCISEKLDDNSPLYILDYGCGEGRYICNLLPSHPNTHFTAYDISSEPLRALANNVKNYGEESRVDIIYGKSHLEDYSRIRKAAPYSIALLLFGVLSHIPSALQRLQTLSYLRDAIHPIHGRVIISVPNKARRFRSIQRTLNSHEITYSRIIKQQAVEFYYYLYDVNNIQRTVQSAGLSVVSISAESVLPESWITNYRLLGWIDRQLCRWIPASWGYGILVSCKVASD